MPNHVLAINAGSSSLKFALHEVEDGEFTEQLGGTIVVTDTVREAEPVLGWRRLERQPRQLAHKFNRAPIDLHKEVQSNDFNSHEAKEDGRDAPEAEVDGANLGVAELAQPIREPTLAVALAEGLVDWQALIWSVPDLDAAKEILVFKH